MMHVLTMKEFEEAVVEGVQKKFPNVKVIVEDVVKTNGVSYRGLRLDNSVGAISAVVPLDSIYNDIRTYDSIDKAVAHCIGILTSSNKLPESINLDVITNFDDIKELILPYVMNTAKNSAVIKKRDFVTVPFLDLTLGFMLYYKNKDASASIKIAYSLFEKWGITKEVLFTQAMANISSKYKFATLDNLLYEMGADYTENGGLKPTDSYIKNQTLDVCEHGIMFVLTNADSVYGAAQIFNKELLKDIGDHMGMDYFILPSSIHELIIVKDFGGDDGFRLKDIVKEVNNNELSADEFLSYSVYKYNRNSSTVSIVA